MIAEVVAREHTAPLRPAGIRRVAILTIGCKLNQAESEAAALELSAAGHHVKDHALPADAFIINTCAVTHVAARKARHLIRLARRLWPGATIVVTGCYAETAGRDELRALGADIVLGNDEKMRAANVLLDGFPCGIEKAPSTRLRTRSFVKVQEGCNDVCAFCIVPQTRGRERSVPVSNVLDAVKRAEADGVQEVVLTGTQLGAYGRDFGDGPNLVDLIDLVFRETAIARIRLSSVQPQDVTPALLALWEDSRLCPHFHIALQSGSDSVLTGMRRRYTTMQFREAVEAIRSRVADAAITTDVLVGFPGETEADFAATVTLCRDLGFAALHVFPFSARPGTVAARMSDHISAATKRARVQAVLALGEELRDRFLSRFVGKTTSVLFEQQTRDGCWEGLTGNYIRVVAQSDESLENRVTGVCLRRREGTGFRGVLRSSLENQEA